MMKNELLFLEYISTKMFRRYFNHKLETKVNKIAIASCPNHPLSLKRICRDKRIYLPYLDFKNFCINFDMFWKLQSIFKNGLIITLENNDFWNIRQSTDALDQEIISRIGSDEIISAIIVIIQGNGQKCDLEKKLLSEFPEFTKVKKLVSQNSSNEKFSSNACWSGEYVVQVSGGDNEEKQIETIQIANDGYEYADEIENNNIELQMTYFLLCSKNAEILLKNPAEYSIIKEKIYAECLKRNILDMSKFCRSPLNKDGFLQCCFTEKVITAEQILGRCKRMDQIDLCHLESRRSFGWKLEGDRVVSNHRLYNLMWGFKRPNMMQGEDSIEEAENYAIEWVEQIKARRSRMIETRD